MLAAKLFLRRIELYLVGLVVLALAGAQVSCIPLPFTLPFSVVVQLDPAGHAFFINIPRTGSFIVTARETGPIDPVTGNDPFELSASNDFGTFRGDLKRDGTFSSTAIGNAAGFSGVEKKLNVTINKTTGAIAGTLEIGTNSALPTGQSIRYGVNSQFNIPTGTPMLSPRPMKMGFYAPFGSNPTPQTLDITNSGTGGMGWFAEVLTGQQVVSVSPVAGQAPGAPSVSLNSSSLARGNHSFSLSLSAFPEGGVLNSPYTVPVELSIDYPYLNHDGTKGVADYGRTPVAGGLAATFGWRLATGTFNADQVPLNRTLGTSMLTIGPWPGPPYGGVRPLAGNPAVDLVPAPLIFVSTGQINFQVPWEYEGMSEVTLQANLGGDLSFIRTVPLQAYAPGIFSLNQQGTGQGAVLLANTDALAAPVGSVPGRISQPVGIGGFLSIFCTELGRVTNRPASGAAASGTNLSLTTTNPIVRIGGVVATPDFSGLAPGFVGLYQVNVPVPAGVTPGNAVPVTITIGGVTSNTVTIAVQ